MIHQIKLPIISILLAFIVTILLIVGPFINICWTLAVNSSQKEMHALFVQSLSLIGYWGSAEDLFKGHI